MTRREETLLHLDLLYSPWGTHVFQVKPERPGSTAKRRNRVGAYPDLAPWLASAQEEGCAVYVQVQEGTSASIPGITRARAFFLDFDQEELPRLPMRPTIVIRTRRGWHVYFNIMPTTELAVWQAMQKGFTRALGADPRCTALNQKARLAGYDHHGQGDPLRMRIVEYRDDIAYTLDDFERYMEEAPIDVQQPDVAQYVANGGTWSFPLLRFWLNRLLRELRLATPGNRFNTLKDVAFQLGCYAAVGLNAGIAIKQMRKVVSRWDDYDQVDGLRTISACFDLGYAHGKVHPPHTPPQQILEFERQERRAELEERVLARVQSSAPGTVLTVEQFLRQYPEWTEAYRAEGAARRGLARLLRDDCGCEEKRKKDQRLFLVPAKPATASLANLSQ